MATTATMTEIHKRAGVLTLDMTTSHSTTCDVNATRARSFVVFFCRRELRIYRTRITLLSCARALTCV